MVLKSRHRRARGQVLVFSALSMVVLVCFVGYATRIVEILALKVEVQNATDAAAYSGAIVQANALALIAATNEAMIFCYRSILVMVVGVPQVADLLRLQGGAEQRLEGEGEVEVEVVLGSGGSILPIAVLSGAIEITGGSDDHGHQNLDRRQS